MEEILSAFSISPRAWLRYRIGKPNWWGWDLAKRQDYTVGIALDGNGHCCRFERFQRIPWGEIMNRIVEATGPLPALVNSTGVGDPILDQLQKNRNTRFEGYHFNAIIEAKADGGPRYGHSRAYGDVPRGSGGSRA